MSHESRSTPSLRAQIELVLLVTVMLLVGMLGWRVGDRPTLRVDPSSLAEFPARIGRWQAVDLPMDSVVESILRADFQLQRAYVNRAEEPIELYVGYYGTTRGGRPEHTPRGCYTGAGWGIEAARTLEVGGAEALRANEYLVERHGERQLVQFWYRSHRQTGLLGGLDQNIDRLIGLLQDGRADGALVRISTRIQGDDVVTARSRLLSFASLADPLLGQHWPVEQSCGDSGDDPCSPITADQTGRG